MNFHESDPSEHYYGQDIATNANGSMILAASANWELQVSYDFGESWNLFQEQPGRGFYNLAISNSGDKIVAAAFSAGDEADKAATLFVSSDYGCTWTRTLSPEYFTENWSTRLASSADGDIVMAATGTNHVNCRRIHNNVLIIVRFQENICPMVAMF